MKVSELARRANVTPEAVRYYVRIDLLRPRRVSKNGYKQFAEPDIYKLRFTRKARLLGYTLSEIRDILRDSDRGKSPYPVYGLSLASMIAAAAMYLGSVSVVTDMLRLWPQLREGR